MVGRKYEAGGIAKDGAKMVMAVANADVSHYLLPERVVGWVLRQAAQLGVVPIACDCMRRNVPLVRMSCILCRAAAHCALGRYQTRAADRPLLSAAPRTVSPCLLVCLASVLCCARGPAPHKCPSSRY